MEQRLANTWHLTVNEKKFIETALLSEYRVDGRRPFDYRGLTIEFGSEDGSSEANEGSLSIYTEFSPMADPAFDAGRPEESAVELGRIIDRGLRESRAVDTESLCVVSGKLVWSVRVDIHILDNDGNLLDAANIAALAALMTFRRPECSLGGVDGQEVIVHPPEVQEPQPLIVHHLPIAVTFAFITDDNIAVEVIDPTYHEEAVMKGRMTVTCLRIACVKAADMTSKIENAVKLYNTCRARHNVMLLSSVDKLNINPPNSSMEDDKSLSVCETTAISQQLRKIPSQECHTSDTGDVKTEKLSSRGKLDASNSKARFMKGPSCWDPYSKGVDSKLLKSSLVSCGKSMAIMENEQVIKGHRLEIDSEVNSTELIQKNLIASSDVPSDVRSSSREIKTLKDAVKLKAKTKKVFSASNAK
ncbi:Exosome complex component RRP45B [Bienertia sinuspersici]